MKSVGKLADEHIAQALNYLKVSQNKVALIVNFNEDKLQDKRLIL
ncbi:MAG: GxxExxY protein [Flavobacteriaceae bacterium]